MRSAEHLKRVLKLGELGVEERQVAPHRSGAELRVLSACSMVEACHITLFLCIHALIDEPNTRELSIADLSYAWCCQICTCRADAGRQSRGPWCMIQAPVAAADPPVDTQIGMT